MKTVLEKPQNDLRLRQSANIYTHLLIQIMNENYLKNMILSIHNDFGNFVFISSYLSFYDCISLQLKKKSNFI